MTMDGRTRRGPMLAATMILLASVIISFILYVETLTPPSRPIDLLVHIAFFPLIYPIAPLFMDSAFGIGSTAYATYPGIALALGLMIGSRAPIGLAAAALLTAYLLPWTTTAMTMGYQTGQTAAQSLGLGIFGQIFVIALPLLAIGALIAPRQSAGMLCLFFGAMIGAVLLVGSMVGSGFGGVAVGGYFAILAIAVAAVVALTQLSGRHSS